MKFQTICAVAVLALANAFAAGVQAADYPERNITVVVPFPPGGASDVTARLTSNKLSERIGKSVIIENRAGANGGLGAAGVKSAAPDGYTLLIGSIGVYAINPGLYKNLKYDPLKDFDPTVVAGAHAECTGYEPQLSGQYRGRSDRASQEEP